MGQAWVEAWFKDGQLEGKARVYFENGNLNAEIIKPDKDLVR